MGETKTPVVSRQLLIDICEAAGWRADDVVKLHFNGDSVQAFVLCRDEEGKRIPADEGMFRARWLMALVGDPDA